MGFRGDGDASSAPMTPKEINRAAGRIFTSFIPPRWALRPQEDQEDYGIDYEVELTTPEDKPTGFIFKVQQKGTASLETRDDAVAFPGLPTEKAYYLEHVAIPVVFVVVDVVQKQAYW